MVLSHTNGHEGSLIAGKTRRLERQAALVLWIQLCCLIANLAIGRSLGAALFLHQFDTQGLSLVYILVGLTVAGLMGLISRLGGRMGSMPVAAGTQLFFYVIVVAAALILPSARGELCRQLHGAIYLLMESFAFVTSVQFWSLANTVLSVDQARRWYVVVGTGGVAGSIAGGVAVGWLADYPPAHALWCIAGLIPVQLFAMAWFGQLGRRLHRIKPKLTDRWNHSVDWLDTGRPRALESRRRPQRHRRSPPRRLRRALGLVALSAVLSTTLIDYHYKTIAERSCAGELRALTAFFGNFYLLVGIATFVVQVLGTSAILRRHAAFAGLALSPAILLGLAIANLLNPSLAGALVFKLADSVLSHNLYRSCQEMLFTPLPTAWVGRLKASSDGVFGRAGLLLAGVFLLAGEPLFAHFSPGWLLPWIIFGIVIWGGALLELRAEYRRQSLHAQESFEHARHDHLLDGDAAGRAA